MVSVFLPGVLPSTFLSPNRGERKTGRVPYAISEAKRQMRADVAVGLLADLRVREVATPIDPCHVVLTLRWWKRKADGFYRPMDCGNAVYSLKAAIDGMIDAGLIIDDSYDHVAQLSATIERCASYQEEGLLITVRALDT